MRPPRVCILGSLNMDLVVRTPRFPVAGENIIAGPFSIHPGGKGANQAVAAARLGAEVSLIGRVGDDDFGRQFRAVLSAEGVDLTHLSVDPQTATGVGQIALDPSGQNTILIALGANETLTPAHVDAAAETIAASSALLMQMENPVDVLLRSAEMAREAGVPVILNAAPVRSVPARLLALTGTLIVNEFEAAALLREHCAVLSQDGAVETARQLAALGPATVVVTLGEQGAAAWAGGQGWEQSAFAVECVDATGAGDAFVAAWAVARLHDRPVAEALRLACAAGAAAVRRAGAIPSMPTEEEVARVVALH